MLFWAVAKTGACFGCEATRGTEVLGGAGVVLAAGVPGHCHVAAVAVFGEGAFLDCEAIGGGSALEVTVGGW